MFDYEGIHAQSARSTYLWSIRTSTYRDDQVSASV